MTPPVDMARLLAEATPNRGLDPERAANDDAVPGQPQKPRAALGWDPYEVWATRVRDARRECTGVGRTTDPA